MRNYDNYSDMNHRLNELFNENIIQDFRDKGRVAWVIFNLTPLIVYPPYGKRYEYIVIASYLNEEGQKNYFSTRNASLYKGISLASIRIEKETNNAHLLQLEQIADNKTVYLDLESYDCFTEYLPDV
jgi:hypothetical protein